MTQNNTFSHFFDKIELFLFVHIFNLSWKAAAVSVSEDSHSEF
jgi:hypothetical protein